MQYIKEMIEVVRPAKIRYIDLVGKKQDKSDLLYKGITEGRFKEEEEAIEELFGNNKHRDQYFREAKIKLQNRLINSLICLKPESHYTASQKALLENYRNFAGIKILLAQGKKKSAIKIAQSTIKDCIKYQLTELVLGLAKELQLFYGSIKGDYRNFRKYSNLVKQYSQIARAEETAQFYYCDISFSITNTKSISPELIQKAKEYTQELQLLVEQHQSYWLNLYAFNVMVFYHQSIKDFTGIIDTCHSAIRYFQSLDYTPSYVSIFLFQVQLIPTYIQMNRYEEAEKVILQCLELAPRGRFNWLLAHQYRLVYAFHSGMYELALDSVRQVQDHLDYQHIKEKWRIYEAYVYFFKA